MQRAILIAVTAFLATSSTGQSGTTVDTLAFITPEIHAHFPGGDFELFCFIDREVDKDLLSSIDTLGAAYARFHVDTLRRLSDIKIIRSLVKEVDDELVHLIELMPDWEPLRIDGKAYASEYNLPFRIPYRSWCDR